MSLHFDQLFRKKLQKVPHFVKKHQKSSIWPKLCIFSNKLPCLCISMNFSAKSCKKCLISWKNTKNHRFGQNLQFFEETTMSWHFHELFRKKLQKCVVSWKSTRNHRFRQNLQLFQKNYHVFTFPWTLWQKLAESASFGEKARKLIDLTETMQLFPTNSLVLVFRWTFQQKVAKSCSIREKARKVIHLAITLQLFEQTTMSLHFDELFSKKLQKVPQFVKKHEKPSIWPKLSIFRGNYDVLAFSWTFQKEVAKSASSREKAREIIDLAKTCNFWKKLPCFYVSMNFMAETCRKCLISWKSTKT